MPQELDLVHIQTSVDHRSVELAPIVPLGDEIVRMLAYRLDHALNVDIPLAISIRSQKLQEDIEKVRGVVQGEVKVPKDGSLDRLPRDIWHEAIDESSRFAMYAQGWTVVHLCEELLTAMGQGDLVAQIRNAHNSAPVAKNNE